MIHRLPPAPGAKPEAGEASRSERAAAARRARARRHYERARSRPARRSRLLSYALLAAAAMLSGAASAGALGTHLVDRWLANRPLEAVRLLGNHQVPSADLMELAGLAQGTDAGSLVSRGVRRALENHPWVARASVQRLPNSQLIIRVEEREAQAIVSTGTETWSLVDGTALPIVAADRKDWPLLPAIHGLGNARNQEARAAEAIAMVPRLTAAGLAEPLDIEWEGDRERAWIVRANAATRTGNGDWPPLELWLPVGDDPQLGRLADLLAAPPILPTEPVVDASAEGSSTAPLSASIGDPDHTPATAAPQSEQPAEKSRVRIDLRFQGRAILAWSDSPSPADVPSLRPNAAN